MPILPNLIYKFIAIPVQISTSYFMDIEKLILKFIWRFKRPKIANRKKNKVGGLTLPYFKTKYKSTVLKIVWYR